MGQRAPDDAKANDQDVVKVYMRQLRAKIADNIAMLQDLHIKFQKTLLQAQEVSNYEAQEEQLRRTAERSRAELDAITERLRAAGWSPDTK